MANIVVSDAAPVLDSITIYQGATFQQAWEYAEEVEGVVGPPLPSWPSQWRARLEIRKGHKKEVLCRFHSEDNTADGLISLGVSDDGLAGTIIIKLEAGISTDMEWNVGVWDLELVHEPTNRVMRILYGRAVLVKEVTTGA